MNKRLVFIAVALLAAFPVLASQSDITPRPNENLKDYKLRVEAYFAPLIAERGLAALLEDEGSEYNEYRRLLQFWEPRLYPHGDFREQFRRDALNYLPKRRRAARHDEDDRAPQSLADGVLPNNAPWQELGPRSKPAGTVGSEGTGPTELIVFYGPSPSRMLCGSNEGGLFYSTNGGLTWSKTGTDTGIGRSGVGAVVFHPTDYRTWFAASGSYHIRGAPGYIGYSGGIFRTTDEGATWSQVARHSQIGDSWTRVFKLVIDPSNANQLWAATSAGLYVTKNALSASPSWTAVPALQGRYIYDLELRPGNSSWLYAALAINPNPPTNWRYVYSSDGGATWQDVQNPPASAATAVALTIEVSPARAENLYMVTIAKNGSADLHIYDFASATASLVYSGAFIDMGGGHGFGVDPFNPNEIFLSQGAAGRRYTAGATPLFVQFQNAHSGGTYHADIEDLIPHPLNANEVWMCHHGGVSVSFDNGATWQDRSNGLGTAMVLRMAAAANDPGSLALGNDHDGSILTTSPWQEPWTPSWKQLPFSYCDGMRPLISPSGQYIWHACSPGSWYRSTNFGAGFSGNSPPYSPDWIAEGVLNRVTTAQFRVSTAAGGHTIMRSTDSGNSWSQIADFGARYPAASYFIWKAYTPETSGETLVVHLLESTSGNLQNHLLRTTIASQSPAAVKMSWVELPIPVDRWLSDVDFDPADPDILYLTYATSTPFLNNPAGKEMVFRYDYNTIAPGANYVCPSGPCRDLTQNLPNAGAGEDALAVERTGGGLYVATDYGVYYSNDVTRNSGNGWTKIGAGFPNVSSNGVDIHQTNKKIRVGTRGRGVWEHDLVATLSGTLFHDLNHNGVRDPGEPPLAGWTIRLDDASGASTIVTTGANGGYTFSALAAGSFQVTEVVPVGWTRTFPASGAHTVSLAAGVVSAGIDFGNDLLARGSCVPPPPYMVAWWTFDEQTGPLAQDHAGFDNTGTHQAAPQVITGKVERALRFNGTTQSVEVQSHPELNVGTGDFTIDAWVRSSRLGLQTILDKRDTPLRGYSLFVFNGRLGFQMSDRPGTDVCSTNNATSACTNWVAPVGSKSVTDGQWHHVAAAVDRDNSSGGLLYVDGTIVLVFDPTIRELSLDNGGPLRIATTSLSTSSWQGDIDEVALFKRALGGSEVQSIYKADRYGQCSGFYSCNPQCVVNDLNGGKVVFSSDRVTPPQLFVQPVGALTLPRQLTTDFFGARHPKWSRNGKYVVYITADVIVGAPNNQVDALVVIDDGVSPNVHLTVHANDFGGTGLGYPQWSDDGKSIVVLVFKSSGRRALGLIEFTAPYDFNQETDRVLLDDFLQNINPGEPVFSLDGQTVYFAADSNQAPPASLFSMPVAVGAGGPSLFLYGKGVPVTSVFAPSLSPDGTRLMFNTELYKTDPNTFLDEEIYELDLVNRQLTLITNEAGNQYGFFAKNGAGEFLLQSSTSQTAQYELFLQHNGMRVPLYVGDPQNLWKDAGDWWKPPCSGGTILWSGTEPVGCKFPSFGAEQTSLCASWGQVPTPGTASCAVCLAAPWLPQTTWSGLTEGADASTAQPADLSCLH
jgi:hypothetical protein